MGDRPDISERITTIKKLSTNILENMIPVMRILFDDHNDITEEIIHNIGTPEDDVEKTIPKVNTWLQTYTEEVVSTARIALSESDKFAAAYAEGDDTLDKNMGNYEMLANVWFGDTYDKDGVAALDLLIKDLKGDLKNTNETEIIKVACKQNFA
jgi:hypothetical protein